MTEIERKYLVKNNSYKVQAQKAGLIIQGYLGDPKYLQSIWSRNAPEPIDDIVQDETIKELDEFGSKEVTFY